MELREILDELAKTNSTAGLGKAFLDTGLGNRLGDFMKNADQGLPEPVLRKLSELAAGRLDGENDGGETTVEKNGGKKDSKKKAVGKKAGGKKDSRKKTGGKKTGRRKADGKKTGGETDVRETGEAETAGDREQPAAEPVREPFYKEAEEPVDLEKMMVWSVILDEPVSRKRRRRRTWTWRSE